MPHTTSHEDITPERLVYFSDAVMAITITLLALDLHVPHAATTPALLQALAGQWANYLSYFISFCITGVAWTNHHRLFARIGTISNQLLLLNTLFLLWLVLIPFATGLLAAYLAKPGMPVGAVVYGAVLTMVGVFFIALLSHVIRTPALLKAGTSVLVLRRLRRHYLLGFCLYLLAMLLAFENAFLSLSLYVFLIILFWLPRHE